MIFCGPQIFETSKRSEKKSEDDVNKKREETQELFKSPLGFNRHSNVTVTLTKDITKYKNIPK